MNGTKREKMRASKYSVGVGFTSNSATLARAFFKNHNFIAPLHVTHSMTKILQVSSFSALDCECQNL